MAIAEATEQMFPMMGDGAEFGKAEEATGAFDGMDCPEDTCQTVGIPRIGFQGDHYDVPERMRDDCIAAGAIPSDSRRLVRALRRLGLRPRRRRSSST